MRVVEVGIIVATMTLLTKMAKLVLRDLQTLSSRFEGMHTIITLARWRLNH